MSTPPPLPLSLSGVVTDSYGRNDESESESESDNDDDDERDDRGRKQSDNNFEGHYDQAVRDDTSDDEGKSARSEDGRGRARGGSSR